MGIGADLWQLWYDFQDSFFDTTVPPMAFVNQSFLILASVAIILISIQIWRRRRI